MNKQQSFTDVEYGNRKRKTKRDEFLEIMEEVIPWEEWCAVMEMPDIPALPSVRNSWLPPICPRWNTASIPVTASIGNLWLPDLTGTGIWSTRNPVSGPRWNMLSLSSSGYSATKRFVIEVC